MLKKLTAFLVASCSLFFLFNCSAQNSSKLQEDKPNIIYILADDLGYNDIGCYGQEKIETPHIDELARNGMVFTQHYANPVCAPTRYSLMTGLNSGHAYIRGNDEWDERGDVWNYKAMEANPALEGQRPIPDSTITVAEVLQKAGYKTALVGKWGLGGPMTTGIPNNQGFDYFFGFLCQRQDHTYYAGHLWENTYRVPLNNEVRSPKVKLPKGLDPLDPDNYKPYSQTDYSPDFIIKAALKFIEKNRSHPFFLYFASPLPHASMQAPEKWVDYYHKKFGDEKPYLGGSYVPCRYPNATRAAMVSLLDEHVGEIVKKLKELGIYKNSIIIFTGDNGPTYEGGTDLTFFNSAAPFKSDKGRVKGSVYEGGIREPFIAVWPGKIKAGSKSDLIFATWDFMPTMCDLVNKMPHHHIQGISFLPTLLSKPQQQKHDYLYWEFPEYGGQQAVRKGKWKAARFNMQKGNTTLKLFDLDKDIQEQHDIAADHPDVVKEMLTIMEKEHQRPQIRSFKIKGLDKLK